MAVDSVVFSWWYNLILLLHYRLVIVVYICFPNRCAYCTLETSGSETAAVHSFCLGETGALEMPR